MNKVFYNLPVCLIITFNSFSQDWLSNPAKTTYRYNAGLAGSGGATSGFFKAAHYPPATVATNYPHTNQTWWHLLDIRHNNAANNYAMQFASFGGLICILEKQPIMPLRHGQKLDLKRAVM